MTSRLTHREWQPLLFRTGVRKQASPTEGKCRGTGLVIAHCSHTLDASLFYLRIALAKDGVRSVASQE